MTLETVSRQKCFGGWQGFYSHDSECTGTPMRFAVYTPPQAGAGPVPVLYYLSGLTCTEETATIKAGAQRLAAEAGLMLVMPDTSPRGAGIEGEGEPQAGDLVLTLHPPRLITQPLAAKSATQDPGNLRLGWVWRSPRRSRRSTPRSRGQ